MFSLAPFRNSEKSSACVVSIRFQRVYTDHNIKHYLYTILPCRCAFFVIFVLACICVGYAHESTLISFYSRTSFLSFQITAFMSSAYIFESLQFLLYVCWLNGFTYTNAISEARCLALYLTHASCFLGTDEDLIISVVSSCNNAQRQELKKTFYSIYQKV